MQDRRSPLPNSPTSNPDSTGHDLLVVQLQNAERTITMLEQRMAKLEGTLASSWATHTRDEYEKNFRASCEQDMRTYVWKYVVGGVLLLAGIGFVLIQSAVSTAFESKNKALIDELRQSQETALQQATNKFEWQRIHNFGTDFIHLAEFYRHVDKAALTPAERKISMTLVFGKAERYFTDASKSDVAGGSTFWELGELYYTNAKKYDMTDEYLNPEKAAQFYETATGKYVDWEIKKGWRGDCFERLGDLALERIPSAPAEKPDLLRKAEGYYQKALTDYRGMIAGKNKDDNIERIGKRIAGLRVNP